MVFVCTLLRKSTTGAQHALPDWLPLQVPDAESSRGASQLSKVVLGRGVWFSGAPADRMATTAEAAAELAGLKALHALRVLSFDAAADVEWASPNHLASIGRGQAGGAGVHAA